MKTDTATQDVIEEFDRFADAPAGHDRHLLFERCREQAPVFFSERLAAWVVFRYGDVKSVIADEAAFRPLRTGVGSPVYGPAMLQWEGREHQKKGGIVAKRLRSSSAVSRFEDFVERTCSSLADELTRETDPVDLKERYATWVPLLVIGELLGVHEAHRFRSWYRDIAAGGAPGIGRPELRERALKALARLGEFLEPLIAERRASPGDDLLSDLCTMTYDGQRLGDDEVRAMTAFLLTAGVETTERVLSSLFVQLFESPEQWATLREHRDLVLSTVVEGLRMFPPVQGVTRGAITNARIAGVEVPEGDRIVAWIASANRDESVFDSPHDFRLDRFAGDAERQFTNAGRILPFGAGRHHCAGSQLARVEMVHAVSALLDRASAATFDGPRPVMEGFMLHSPDAINVRLVAAGDENG